jgi:hypothetical protein
VSEEATKLVSLISIVSRSDVSIVCHNEMVLSHLVLQMRDSGSVATLRYFGKSSRSQECLIFLILEHRLELRSHGHAHLIDFTLTHFYYYQSNLHQS